MNSGKPLRKTKTARENPAPLIQIKMFADQPLRISGAGAGARNGAEVGQPADLVEGTADAGADKRGNAPPGAEIDVDVGHSDPAGKTGAVGVGDRPEARDISKIGAAEVHLGAPFTGD